MVQWVFISALTLVSALALALVYGLGGWFALAGTLDPGDVVALALLLTRLYAPLTSLASARVEVMTALVSFERVFEVLDLEPLIAEPEHPRPLPDGRGLGGARRRAVRLPRRRQGVARLAGGGRPPRHARRRRGAARRLVPRRAGADGRAGRLVGGGQVDDRLAAPPPVRRRRGRGPARRRRRARPHVRRDPRRARDGHPGRAPVPRVAAGQPAARPAGRRRRPSCGTRCAAPGSPTWSRPCPTASTPWSASAATGSPAASASA